jgi:hypothetical protein
MKLESIFDMWDQDSRVDRQRLDEEALNISVLHAKYHRIFTNERLALRKYEAELKELKLQKFEFYTQGPTKETVELGWQLPPIGKVLKADANTYVDADKDIINLSLKIGIQHEKIGLLESIIRTLQNRGYNIRAAIDYIKFTSGG